MLTTNILTNRNPKIEQQRAMEAVHEFRVPEGQICATATPEVLLHFGSVRSLIAGSAEHDVSFWSWAGSSDGRVFYESNQSKQRPVVFPLFRMQVDYLRAALEIFCSEFFTPDQPVPAPSRFDAPSYAKVLHRLGRSVCEYGKNSRILVLMFHFGMPWIRYVDIRLILNGLVKDQERGESMDLAPRCFEVSLPSATQIGVLTILEHSFNRGLADHAMQMRVSLNRSPELRNGLSSGAKYCRIGVDPSDLPRSRQKQNGFSPDPELKAEKHRRQDLEEYTHLAHLEISKDTGSGKAQSQRRHQVTKHRFQIFIKTPEMKTLLVWVNADSSVLQLKQQICALIGYPEQIQHLASGRRSLQDNRTLGSYEISPGETIVLNLRLRGGAPSQGQPTSSRGGKGKTVPQQKTKGAPSYKNILQGNKGSGSSPDQGGYTPRPYIVDQLEQTPAFNIDFAGPDDYVQSYETQALICHFNSFWPKPLDLFHWIFTTWTMECDIHLCSKGFFIVRFTSKEITDTIISIGPWFSGTAGLFMTPWFKDFDPNKMTVTKMPVWVRLHNLPLHFWSERVLEGIGNSIGKYIKTDLERIDERLFTFARICVEVDLSKGLPDNIRLIYKQQNWLQVLDYKNTAF